MKKKPNIGGYFILSASSWLGNHPVWKTPRILLSESDSNSNANFR